VTNLDQAILGLILFGLLPLWMIAGFVDYLCHRQSQIEHTSGVKECVLHIVMGFQVGIPVFMALVFEINVLVTLVCLAMLVAHEVVAVWDVRLATPVRRISHWETHAHAFLLTIPFYTFALVALLNWQAFVATIRFDWSEQLSLVLRPEPIGPRGYLAYYFVTVFALGLLPYGEELRRCLRARRARAAEVTS
jgi:hypothetical protein